MILPEYSLTDSGFVLHQVLRYTVLYEDLKELAFATITSSGVIAILFTCGVATFRRRVGRSSHTTYSLFWFKIPTFLASSVYLY
jgi:hypothetical protein